MNSQLLRQAYSEHYKNVADDQSSFQEMEQSDLLMKTKRLQRETNKRRRASALKRKQQAVLEEQRRQEILNQRREEQKHATERFQYFHHYRKSHRAGSPTNRRTPTLEDALATVKGGNSVKYGLHTGSDSKASIYKNSSNGVYGGTPQSRVSSAGSIRQHIYQSSKEQQAVQTGQSNLRNSSLQNFNNSRNLFEEQVQQQKHLQQQQQKHALQQQIMNDVHEEFIPQSEEMRYEDGDGYEQLSPSSSISSVDSLESVPVRRIHSHVPQYQYKAVSGHTQRPTTFQPQPYAAQPGSYTSASQQVSASLAQPQQNLMRTSQYAHSHVHETQPYTSHTLTQNQSIYTPQSNTHMSHTQQSLILSQQHRNATNVAVVPPTNISYENKPPITPASQNASSTKYYNLKTQQSEMKTEQLKIEDVGEDLKVEDLPMSIMATSAAPATIQRAVTVSNLSAGQPASSWKHDVTQNPKGINILNPTAPHDDKSQMAEPQNGTGRAWVNTSMVNTTPLCSSKPYAYNVPTTPLYKHDQPTKTEQFSTAIPQSNPDSKPPPQTIITENNTNGKLIEKEDIIIDDDDTETEAVKPVIMLKKDVKGILKATKNNVAMNVKGQAFGKKGNNVRDSLEMHRTHKYENGERKRTIYFADEVGKPMEDVDFGSDSSELDDVSREQEDVPVFKGPRRLTPNRPSSAVVQGSSTIDARIKQPRVASAGYIRRTPFIRPSIRSAVAQAAASRANTENRDPLVSQTLATQSYYNRYTKRPNVGTTQATPIKPTAEVSDTIPLQIQDSNKTAPKSNGGVYNANGIRLDRTPTDDEINWLWEKVRTCLSKDKSAQPEEPPTPKPSIYLANKYIDGQNIPVPNRTALKKTSVIGMNTLNSYGIQQPKSSTTPTPAHEYQQSSTHYQPTPSVQPASEPQVSDSMAAFLTAEKLSEQQQLSESHIMSAMDKAPSYSQKTAPAEKKAPTALSIEENRLLMSLERLNERLKLTEAAVTHTHQNMSTAYTPRPPAASTTRGFRGHAPISSAPPRRYTANSNGMVPRHQYRAASAGTQKTYIPYN